jgi:hypothetical protein
MFNIKFKICHQGTKIHHKIYYKKTFVSWCLGGYILIKNDKLRETLDR